MDSLLIQIVLLMTLEQTLKIVVFLARRLTPGALQRGTKENP